MIGLKHVLDTENINKYFLTSLAFITEFGFNIAKITLK